MLIVFNQDHDYCTARKVHLPGQMSYDKKVYKKGVAYDVDDDFGNRCVRMGVADEEQHDEPTARAEKPHKAPAFQKDDKTTLVPKGPLHQV